ncbi:MAG: hypothetical protein K2O12_06595, partial [Muribaculaceae bacterium]|nr:hypothetical protein [Muribaculaceae bacterium]
GYIIWYFIYMLIVYTVYRYRYGMRMRPGIILLAAISMVVAILAVTGYYTIGPWLSLLFILPPVAWYARKNMLK